MKRKHALAHMYAAFGYAKLSYCIRKRVGCVIIKDKAPIAYGWNGMPSGEDHCCEDEEGNTKPGLVHAEENALRKLWRSHDTTVNADVFVTVAPCLRCAEKLVDAGVSTVYYSEVYKSASGGGLGLEYLDRHGVYIEQITEEEILLTLG